MARYIWGSKRPLQAIKVVILSANSPFDAAKIRISEQTTIFLSSEFKDSGINIVFFEFNINVTVVIC